jgi:hypothetical protein
MGWDCGFPGAPDGERLAEVKLTDEDRRKLD